MSKPIADSIDWKVENINRPIDEYFKLRTKLEEIRKKKKEIQKQVDAALQFIIESRSFI